MHLFRGWLLPIVWMSIAFIIFDHQAFAQDQVSNETWHVRLVWGGGKARAYRGSIQIEQGKIKQLHSLGVRSSSVLEVVEESPTRLAIDTDASSQFVGVDLEIQGGPSTLLRVSLTNADPGGKAFEQECRLSEIETESRHWNIDDHQNRIFVDRVPGDRLRAICQLPHLILKPHERMDVQVQPFRTGLAEGACQLKVKLVRDIDQQVVFEETYLVNLDNKGTATPLSVGVDAPDREGVYHWQFQLEPRRRLGSLLSNRPLVQRNVQWVVMGATTPSDGEANLWQSVATLDLFVPSTPIGRPLLRRLTGNDEYPASSSAPLESRQSDDKQVLVIPSNAWRSLPLESLKINMPHQVVVHVPRDRMMQCALVVLEPNATGQLEVASLEGGIQVTEEASGLAEYRLAFWPKTSNPQLVFYNPNPDRVASIAQVEILAGPDSLSSLAESEKKQRSTEPRLVAMQVDGVQWFKQFGVASAFDAEANRPLADWNTLYTACKRLAEYCHWAGYNSVVVSGMTDGGTLYPSRSIRGNARLDQGMFFSDGRDPMRKDVLELMMQLFDREGLRLIVGWHFNAPLLELERFRGSMSPSGRSIDQCNPEGTPWHLSETSLAHSRRYHPLHPEYQRLLASHCSEFLQRYGKHSSWAGISLQVSPSSHSAYAGLPWAWDDVSLYEFAKSMNIRIPDDASSRQDTLMGPVRAPWLQWRSSMLSQSWDRLHRQLAQSDRSRQLIVDTSALLEFPPMPTVTNGRLSADVLPLDILTAHGIGIGDTSKQPEYTWLRSDMEQDLLPIVERRWQAIASTSSDLDQLVRSKPRSGAQLKQTSVAFALDGLPHPNSAQGSQETIWLNPQLCDYGSRESRRLARRLHADDARMFVASGPGILNPADAILQQYSRTFANLAPEKMLPIPMGTQGDSGNNVQFRSLVTNEGSYFALLNNAPWAERVECEWGGGQFASIEWISEVPSSSQTDLTKEGLPRSIVLQPFQLLAWRIPENSLRVISWRHRAVEDVRMPLARSLEQLAVYLNRTATQHSSYQISNEDFEAEVTSTNPVPGWKTSILPSTLVTIDQQVAHAGTQSLRMEHQGKQGSAWILSSPIKPPITGRLSLECYVRANPSKVAPALEVNLNCRRKDGSKYTLSYPLVMGDSDEQRFVDPTGVATPRPRWAYCTVPLLKDTSTDSLAEVQFSIDLKSQGTVWIDDLRLNDLFLIDEERRSLRADLFMSTRELDRGNYALAQRLLDSYWAEYLHHFAWDEPDRVDQVAAGVADRKIMTSAPNPNVAREPGDGSTKATRERDRPWLRRVREGLLRSRRDG